MLVMLQNRNFMNATSPFLGQAVGCVVECSKWEVTGYVRAKHAGCASSDEVRGILQMPWTLRTGMGMVNWKLVADLNATAATRPEVYGPGGSRGTSTTDVGVATQIMTELGVDSFNNFGVASSDSSAKMFAYLHAEKACLQARAAQQYSSVCRWRAVCR